MSSDQRPADEPRRKALRKTYNGLKWAAIVLIALTMAEFLALDMAMLVASDIILYVELVVASWALSALALLHPAIGYRFTMLGSRIFGGEGKADGDRPKE